jgi:ABC-type transport system substrate-binding protein
MYKTPQYLIALVVVFLSSTVTSHLFADSTLNIGVVFDGQRDTRTISIYESSLAGSMLRAVTTQALVEEYLEKGPRYGLQLAKQFLVSGDKKTWRFTLPTGKNFTNGERVTAQEGAASLQICQKEGVIPTPWNIYSEIKRSPFDAPPYAKSQEHVIVELPTAPLSSQEVLAPISKCPILLQRARTIFGPLHGVGGNYISTGPFRVFAWKRERRVVVFDRELHSHEKQNKEFNMSFYSSADDLLAGLRRGAISLGVVPLDATDVVSKVASDDTLLVLLCGTYHLMYRKEVSLSCDSLKHIDLLPQELN